MGSSEVFTHTPILKELLDPRGSHGQGNLFLKSFIDSFCSEFIVDEFVQIKKEQQSIEFTEFFKNAYENIR